MKEYMISVFAICVAVGLFGFLSHGRLRSAERVTMGIIVLWVIISPLSSAVKNIDFDDLGFSDVGQLPELNGGYSAVAEEAFGRGIILLVADEFSLDPSDMRVKITGFDPETMSAEKIRLILGGGAAMADYRAVESFLNKQNLGKCEVEIEIG